MAFKRSQLPHRSHESKGKMDSQVYTLPSPWFYCTQRIPGRHTHRAEESEETLKTWEVLILNHWVAAGCLGVIVTQAGSSTHDLLFPLAGERLPWTWFVSHMSPTSGFLLLDTKRFQTAIFLWWHYANRKLSFKTFANSFGYPRAFV